MWVTTLRLVDLVGRTKLRFVGRNTQIAGYRAEDRLSAARGAQCTSRRNSAPRIIEYEQTEAPP